MCSKHWKKNSISQCVAWMESAPSPSACMGRAGGGICSICIVTLSLVIEHGWQQCSTAWSNEADGDWNIQGRLSPCTFSMVRHPKIWDLSGSLGFYGVDNHLQLIIKYLPLCFLMTLSFLYWLWEILVHTSAPQICSILFIWNAIFLQNWLTKVPSCMTVLGWYKEHIPLLALWL